MNEFLVLTRAIHFGAALWLFGEFVLFAVVVGPALRSVSHHASIDSREPERRLLRVSSSCVAIGIASAIAWLLLEAANMSGMPLMEALNRRTLDAALPGTATPCPTPAPTVMFTSPPTPCICWRPAPGWVPSPGLPLFSSAPAMRHVRRGLRLQFRQRGGFPPWVWSALARWW